jgi:MFS family permease
VESRAAEPVVPLHLVRQRTTALAILASLAVGIAMFGGSVFLGQYFQIGRGYSPTKAGLLTIPMMAGVLTASITVGQLVTRTGRIKPYLVSGTLILIAGFAGLATVDHTTSLIYIGVAMFAVGIGVGMTMQNLVLAVQNTVALRDIGAASSTVSFFRSLGGAIGVSVLGAVLAHQVTRTITQNLTKAHIPTRGGSSASALNTAALPPVVRDIVSAAYGDATGHIFLLSGLVAIVGVLAVVLLKPVTLRSSLDLPDPTTLAKTPAPAAAALS